MFCCKYVGRPALTRRVLPGLLTAGHGSGHCLQECGKDAEMPCTQSVCSVIATEGYNRRTTGYSAGAPSRASFHIVARLGPPRFVIFKCTLNSTPYTLASIYAPNSPRLSFFNSMIKRVNSISHVRLIIAGNFNSVLNKQMDRSEGCAR